MNAERLLGALLKQGLRSGRRRKRRRSSLLGGLIPGGMKGAAGLGLLGVAIAAYEHFSRAGQTAAKPPPPSGATPPPPAGRPSAVPPPPPPPAPGAAGQAQNDGALLLIKGMIAAANADGQIDPAERASILEKLDHAGLDLDEREFVERELASPSGIDTLIGQVDSPELAKQFYAASLLAIEVDTEAERAYLSRLQDRLGLDRETVDELHRQFEK